MLPIHLQQCDSLGQFKWLLTTQITVSATGVFAAAEPHLWNMLPIHLQQCDSLGQFKWLLMTHMFGDWDCGAL